MSDAIDFRKVKLTLSRRGIERPVCTIDEILSWVFDGLEKGSPITKVEEALRDLQRLAEGVDPIRLAALREAAMKKLHQLGVKSTASLVDAALTKRKMDPVERQARKIASNESKPWPDPVAGAELFDEIQDWIAGYVAASEESLVAVTLWAVATWFVSAVYFAPILAILSPTKRSGKTLLLDLLRWICRKPELTSGVGITSAVLFRMNQQYQPTFLIDEAEKLSGKNGDKEIISLLNQGYRRGAKVPRCREQRGGEYIIEKFDAFGFRAAAAIGTLWDTLIDRAVIIPMKRKPKTEKRKRFNGRKVETEGRELSRKICRFTQDNLGGFDDVQRKAPRPDWLHDRGCDNWAGLFAVAQLAGGDWPKKALETAKTLSSSVEDGDRAERLIHDTCWIFEDAGSPEVIKSGDLVQHLNAIEASPWGDFNKGNGISTHKLAAMFKPFGIRPSQQRDRSGATIRGYWLKDLQGAFQRYPLPSKVVQVVQANNDGTYSDFQSGTENESCTTSKSPKTRTNTDLYHLSHSEREKEDEPVNRGWDQEL